MVRPLVQPKDSLSIEEIRGIPMDERGKYIERYLYELVKKQADGLTLHDIQQITNLPKSTLSKYLELLFSKRKIFKIKRGRFVLFKPNGKIFHPLLERDLILGEDKSGDIKKYRLYLIENPDGRFLYIQEKQIDGNGFEDIIGGIMIPLRGLSTLIEKLNGILGMKIKIDD